MDYRVLDKKLKEISHTYKGFERRVEKEREIETFYKTSLSDECSGGDESKIQSENNTLLYRYKKLTFRAKVAELLILPIIVTILMTGLTAGAGYVISACTDISTQYQEIVVSGQAQFDDILQQADPSSYAAKKEIADTTMTNIKQDGVVISFLNGVVLVLSLVTILGLIYLLVQIYSLSQGLHEHEEFEIKQLVSWLKIRKQLYLERHPHTEELATK